MSLLDRFISSWQELTPFFDNGLMIAFMMAAFMYASYTDLMQYKIYDKFNFFLYSARIVFVFLPVYGVPVSVSHLLGMVVAVLALLIPAVVFLQKMGGDIKFMGVMGLYMGVGLTIFTLVLGCAYMLLFSLGRKIITKKEVKHLKTPMAPFFFAAFFTLTIIALFL